MTIINSLQSVSVWPRLIDGQNGSVFFSGHVPRLCHIQQYYQHLLM